MSKWEHLVESDVTLRNLERKWNETGSTTDLNAYLSALYRANRRNFFAEFRGNTALDNDIRRWMLSRGSPPRKEVEDVAARLRKMTPEGLAAATPATSGPYGLTPTGIRIYLQLAIGKTFNSGFTPANAGVEITIDPAGDRLIHVGDRRALERYPLLKAYAKEIRSQFRRSPWRVTVETQLTDSLNESDEEIRRVERELRSSPTESRFRTLIRLHRSVGNATEATRVQQDMTRWQHGRIGRFNVEALDLGTIIYHMTERNADGSAQRWRVNGRIKLWKTRPTHFRVPLKQGMYNFGYLTHDNADEFTLRDPTA
jgi:hypothetical protein